MKIDPTALTASHNIFVAIYRFNFSTADSSNSVQICDSVGLHDVVRLEVSTRYLVTFKNSKKVNNPQFEALAAPLHDRMTQCIYTKANLPRHSFNEGLPKDLEPWFVVPLQKEGRPAMEHVNQKLGKPCHRQPTNGDDLPILKYI